MAYFRAGGGKDYSEQYTIKMVEAAKMVPTSAASLFYGNTTFNKSVTIGSNVADCSFMFLRCSSLNKPITIGGATSCRSMFTECYSFNQPVTIPSNTTDCSFMFSECYNLNNPIVVNGPANCSYMFANCSNLNKPVTIGSITNCRGMFNGCFIFNQPFTIPSTVSNCAEMFRNCANMSQNIYIKRTSDLNVSSMLKDRLTSKRINVFCNNLSIINKTDWRNSIVGADITWTSTTNGYYNTSYNVYIYNNYS